MHSENASEKVTTPAKMAVKSYHVTQTDHLTIRLVTHDEHSYHLDNSFSLYYDTLETIIPSSKEGSTLNLALTGQAVSETNKFENNYPIHLYSPGAWAD